MHTVRVVRKNMTGQVGEWSEHVVNKVKYNVKNSCVKYYLWLCRCLKSEFNADLLYHLKRTLYPINKNIL